MDEPDVCRICRAEATADEPLYHPCKCAGSIQYVHQDCLLEWLEHTMSLRGQKAQCDLCKTPYRLRKRFRRTMPSQLAKFDYVVYAYKKLQKNLINIYYSVRVLAMVVVLSITLDFILGGLILCAESSYSFPEAFRIQRRRLFGSALINGNASSAGSSGDDSTIASTSLHNGLHSKAPYIDYVLGFVWPACGSRTMFVHGFLLILSFIVVITILWVVAVWVLNEDTVRHDLEHIIRGEIAHMDHGDEDELFEFLSTRHSDDENSDASEDEEYELVRANTRIVPASQEAIPYLPSGAWNPEAGLPWEPVNRDDGERAIVRLVPAHLHSAHDAYGISTHLFESPLRENGTPENDPHHNVIDLHGPVSHLSQISRTSPSVDIWDAGVGEILVYFLPVGVSLDPKQPFKDLVDPDDVQAPLPPGITRDQIRDMVLRAREATDIGKGPSPVGPSSRMTITGDEKEEMLRLDGIFSEDRTEAPYADIDAVRQINFASVAVNDDGAISSAPNSHSHDHLTTAEATNTPRKRHAAETFEATAAQSKLFDRTKHIHSSLLEKQAQNGSNPFKGSSEEYLASLGASDPISYPLDPAAQVSGGKFRAGRVILTPPENLYIDRDDLVQELRDMLQDHDDEEGFGPLLRQIVVLFQRPNVETLAIFLNVEAMSMTLVVACVLFYRTTLASYHYMCLALYVLLVEPPVSYLTAYAPSFVTLVKSGVDYFPTTLKERLAVQLSMFALGIAVLRYTVLVQMKRLLKLPSGRRFVQSSYEFYVVVKTLLMTLIETLLFPEFCGSLLHVVAVPLAAPPSPVSSFSWAQFVAFVNSGIQWHNQHYRGHLGWTLLLQWLAGYIYMHGLQVMVAACRKVLRQGVLFFLHDTDAVYFLRSMLLVSLPKQIYRITISASLYGLMILLGVGSTTLLLRFLEPRTWPLNVIHWPGLNLLRMWWVLVIFRAFSVTFTGTGGDPEKRSYKYIVVTLWLRERLWLRILEEASRLLDLQSWLFAVPKELDQPTMDALSRGDRSRGSFVRAPYGKLLKVRRKLNLFVPVDAYDRRLDGKRGVMDKELQTYTVVWRPPYFQARLAGLATLMWASVSFVTLLFTLVPLTLGRSLDYMLWDSQIKNDLVLTLGGLLLLLPVYGSLMYRFPMKELEASARFKAVRGRVPLPTLSQMVATDNVVSAFLMTVVGALVTRLTPSQQYYWLVLNVKSTQSYTVASQLLVLDCLFLVTFNSVLPLWFKTCRFNVSHLLIVQSALELFGYSSSNLFSRLVIFSSSMALIALTWSKSQLRRRVQEGVREANYLEGIEVENYYGGHHGQPEVPTN